MVCNKGELEIESCIENDKRKILNTDPSNHSHYADFWRKVEWKQDKVVVN